MRSLLSAPFVVAAVIAVVCIKAALSDVDVEDTVSIEPKDRFTLSFKGDRYDRIKYEASVTEPTGVLYTFILASKNLKSCSSKDSCDVYPKLSSADDKHNVSIDQKDVRLDTSESIFMIMNPSSFDRHTVKFTFVGEEANGWRTWKWWVWMLIIGIPVLYLACVIGCAVLCC